MKKLAILILVLFAAGVWYFYRGECGAPAEDTAVVIAVRTDIQPGTVIAEDMLETLTLPRRYLQQGAYEVRGMGDIRRPVGLKAAVRIPKGDQLTQNCLAGEKAEAASKAPTKKEQAQAHYSEGIKYFQNANYDKAKAEWEQALKLDPRNEDAAAGLKRVKQIQAGGQ